MSQDSEAQRKLEGLIDRALRDAPLRRAPASLESRVFAAIDAQVSQPWWRKSFGQWPIAARLVFGATAVGFAKLAVDVTDLFVTRVDATAHAVAATPEVSAAEAAISAVVTTIHSIPAVWLQGGFVFLGLLYFTLFGVGAIAYRTLYRAH